MMHPRRAFLLRVLAAWGTPFVAPVVSARGNQRPAAQPRAVINSRIASYFGTGVAGARAIGEAYLRQLKVSPTRASILEHAAGAMTVLEAARSQKAALTELTNAVRRDFQDGRVLQLEGWVLSRTEVELCVLVLLPAAPAGVP